MNGYRQPHDEAEDDDEFVPLVRPVDPMQASLVEQMLREEKIPCRVLGTRDAALIGVAQHALALRIEVPRSRLAHAEEVLAALDEPDSVEDPIDAPENEEDEDARDDDAAGDSPRRVVLAVGATMLLFGGSHFYARRPWTAGVLAVTQLGALLVAFGAQFPDRFMGGMAMPLVLFVDVVFGVRAARAFNRGVRPSIGAQLATGVAYALVIVSVAAAFAWREV